MPGLKFTVPEVLSELMPLNVTPGPSYPVVPKGQPDGWGVMLEAQMPSPSNENMLVVDVRGREKMVPLELFWTPVNVSSLFS